MTDFEDLATPESLITLDAVNNLNRIIDTIRELEANDYWQPVDFTGTTSNPPIQSELDGILDTPASYNANMVALVKDTTNDRNWLVFGDQVDWYSVRVWNDDDPTIGARVFHNVNQSTTTAVAKILNFNSETYDFGGFHDNSTNNTRLTIPENGIYNVGWGITWGFSGGGSRRVFILLNGSTIINLITEVPQTTSNHSMSSSFEYLFSTDDYVEIQVIQNSGAGLDVVRGADYSPLFTISRIL